MDRARQVKLAFEQLNTQEKLYANGGMNVADTGILTAMRENVIKAFGMHAQGITPRQLTETGPVWMAFNRLASAEEELRDHKGDQVAQLLRKVEEARNTVEVSARQVLSNVPRMMGVQKRVEEAIPGSKRPRPDAGGGEQASDQTRPAGSGGFVDLSQDSD